MWSIHSPLFVLDRRLPRRTVQRRQFQRNGVNGAGAEVPKDDALEGLPFVSFLKLTGIVATGVTPIVLILFLIINANISATVSRAFDKAATTFVSKEIYDLKHDDLKNGVTANKARVESVETRLAKMELQLQQIQQTVEAIRAKQASDPK